MADARWSDPAFKKLYLSVLSAAAAGTCAPFWWSVKSPGAEVANILHNGTICYVNTGERCVGVTADHVFAAYLADLAEHRDGIECQFGGSTIRPESRLIDRSNRWDLATFDVPEVFVAASKNQKSHHTPPKWPPSPPDAGAALLYGGFPGKLREERGVVAELPFQWVASRAIDVTDQNIALEPNFETMNWQGQDANDDPGGWSGGPVFRYVEDGLIAYAELVGFIYEFPFSVSVLARHAGVVLPDGTLAAR